MATHVGLQARCPEAQAFVLSGNKDVTQYLRMRADQRMPITIGGMDCRLVKYTVSLFNTSALCLFWQAAHEGLQGGWMQAQLRLGVMCWNECRCCRASQTASCSHPW